MRRLYPAVSFLYFAAVIAFAITVLHPLLLAVSLAAAVCYALKLERRGMGGFLLKFCLPMLLLTVIINPLVNHRGVTVLFYLGKNAVTLEATLFGLAAGGMLVCVLCWFRCFTLVLDNEKNLFLFGRLLPALALTLAMSMRFLPLYRLQIRRIAEARAGIGLGLSENGWRQRLHSAFAVVSAMTGWALEGALQTADAMKARGYGGGPRSSFSIYRWQRRDKWYLALILLLLVLLGLGVAGGYFSASYYPALMIATPAGWFWPVVAVYALFCFLPCMIKE